MPNKLSSIIPLPEPTQAPETGDERSHSKVTQLAMKKLSSSEERLPHKIFSCSSLWHQAENFTHGTYLVFSFALLHILSFFSELQDSFERAWARRTYKENDKEEEKLLEAKEAVAKSESLKSEALRHVTQDGLALQNLSESLKSDPEIIRAALTENGRAIRHIDPSQITEELAVLAVQESAGASAWEDLPNEWQLDPQVQEAAIAKSNRGNKRIAALILQRRSQEQEAQTRAGAKKLHNRALAEATHAKDIEKMRHGNPLALRAVFGEALTHALAQEQAQVERSEQVMELAPRSAVSAGTLLELASSREERPVLEAGVHNLGRAAARTVALVNWLMNP